jgi:hypothetical protein
MMWLKIIVVQEIPEKVTNRESESSLKVRYEDYPLSRFRCRDSFSGRQPA